MGVEHRIIRSSVFKGLNKTQTEILLTNEYSTYLKNVSLRDTGAIEKRKGFHSISKVDNTSSGSHYDTDLLNTKDLFTYTNINRNTGELTKELYRIYQDGLQKYKNGYSMVVKETIDPDPSIYNAFYTGNLVTGSKFYVDKNTNTFAFEVYSGTRVLTNIDVGTGNSTDPTVDELRILIEDTDIPIIIPSDTYFSIHSAFPYLDPTDGLDYWLYKIENWSAIANIDTNFVRDAAKYDLNIYIPSPSGNVSFRVDAIDDQFLHLRHQSSSNVDADILYAAGFYRQKVQVEYTTPTTTINPSNTAVPSIFTTVKAACMNLSPVGEMSYNVQQWEDVQPNRKPFSHLLNLHTDMTSSYYPIFYNEGEYDQQQQEGEEPTEIKHISNTTINDVMYFADGVNYPLKYDGHSVYRMGLPAMIRNPDETAPNPLGNSSSYNPINLNFTDSNCTTTTNTTSALDPGIRTYRLQLEYTDVKGNIISSTTSNPVTIDTHTDTSNHEVTIKWGYLEHALRYPAWYAPDGKFVNNNFETGDNIPFWGFDTEGKFSDTDEHGVEYFPNMPTAYDSAWDDGRKARSKLKNEYRLRMKIWRTRSHPQDAPGQYYLLADLSYNQGAYTQTINGTNYNFAGIYIDKIGDDDLNDGGGATTVLLNEEPQHYPPPRGSSIITHKGITVIAGNPKDVNAVNYSLSYNNQTGEIGSEYFPISNSIVVESPFGGRINAIESLNDMIYVFHDQSVSVIAGDIQLGDLPASNILTKEGGIGCLSHKSIKELNGKLYFISNMGGIYSISSAGLIEESERIKTLFYDLKSFSTYKARTYNWTSASKMIFSIPKEEIVYYGGDSSKRYRTTTEVFVVVYDYANDAWFQWENIDFTGGVISYENELFFSPQEAAVDKVNKFSETGTLVDYTDNENTIEFNYTTNWESLGEPTIPKKFLRLKLYAIDSDNTFECPGFELNVGVQREYVDGNIADIQYDFGITNEGYGGSPWGEFSWGEAIPYMFRSKLPTKKTKALRLSFSNNNLNENVLINSWEIETALSFGTEIK